MQANAFCSCLSIASACPFGYRMCYVLDLTVCFQSCSWPKGYTDWACTGENLRW